MKIIRRRVASISKLAFIGKRQKKEKTINLTGKTLLAI